MTAGGRYIFRLHREASLGDFIYVGELLESPNDSNGSALNTGGREEELQFRLRLEDGDDEGGVYVGELLEGHDSDDTTMKERQAGDDGVGNEECSSTLTMEAEQANTINSPSESPVSIKDEEEEYTPYQIEELYVTNGRRAAVEIGKLPLDVRYQVYQWLFNNQISPDEVLEIPEDWTVWPGFEG